jgi:excisionase family DNA binding protein
MERLTYKPGEVGVALGCGRTKAYELISSGELPSIRIGSIVRVPVAALKEWVERKTAEKAAETR